jgi:cytosine/adenosine deaminase-related metal-dependent hydrolase
MEWAYNQRMECWIAQVGVSGTFKLVREETLNNVTVGPAAVSTHTHIYTHLTRGQPLDRTHVHSWLGSAQLTSSRRHPHPAQVSSSTLEPTANGILSMFSFVYPGPGFTGTYDCERGICSGPGSAWLVLAC